jgi:hypothetical protein
LEMVTPSGGGNIPLQIEWAFYLAVNKTSFSKQPSATIRQPPPSLCPSLPIVFVLINSHDSLERPDKNRYNRDHAPVAQSG